ncbi:MAG: fluoride efflux transporter CrcB [Spirochaetes bacterium]|nr:fluoride efflux transporter CrcB [Spirochaetota bacterium]
MRQLIPIAVGGSVGALMRFTLSRYITQAVNTAFPVGTAAVNITGSLIIGFAYVLFSELSLSPELRSFFIIGLLGAFTTFSTFSLETMTMLEDGEVRYALYNVLINNLMSLTAACAGILLCRILLRAIKAG